MVKPPDYGSGVKTQLKVAHSVLITYFLSEHSS